MKKILINILLITPLFAQIGNSFGKKISMIWIIGLRLLEMVHGDGVMEN